MNILIIFSDSCVYVCLLFNVTCYYVVVCLVCTSSPCLRTLRVDRGPRPQATYNCGVSSLAKSAICQKQERSRQWARKQRHQSKKSSGRVIRLSVWAQVHANTLTWQVMMGDKFSCSSTSTRFLRGRGWKKKVSPSSRGIAEENSGSSSSSPKWAIW